jgi:L-aspartate oxidase
MLPRYLVNLQADDLKRKQTDYLVIGSGIAGMTAALELADAGEVTVLTKEDFAESNTKYAQGGIAAAWDREDSPEFHFRDTSQAGVGLCNPQAVKSLVNSATTGINRLIEWGVNFDTTDEQFALTKEGGHNRRRILHAGGDATGREISSALVEQVQNNSQIEGKDNNFVLDLVTENGSCYGVYAYDTRREEYIIYYAKAVVLATGGSGKLYATTSNPELATGDGLAMAYRAGVELMDLEMIQFHPTVLNLEDEDDFLISEAVRGEGAKLRTTTGTRFMSNYHKSAELAPRDVVSQAIEAEIGKQQEDYVYLDLTDVEGEFIQTRFPTIYKKCLAVGIDITTDYIPVRPAAHYLMGGIKTDLDAKTNLDRLFACGEVACLGVHGANRLASNSLLEGLVFGARAAAKIKEEEYDLIPDIKSDQVVKKRPEQLEPLRIKEDLQELMQKRVGLVRQKSELKSALNWLEEKLGILPFDYTTESAWEVQNMLTVAYLITKSALLRTESRGAHYRVDYPETDREWKKHIVQHCENEWRMVDLELE